MPAQYLLPFVKGLNTDQGVITGDSGFTRDESNVVLQKDGSRKVRLGLDYESNILQGLTGTTINTTAFTSYTWEAAGNKDKTFIVMQQGYKLHFFDAGSSSIIAGFHSTIELTTTPYYNTTTASDCRVEYAPGNGSLFIAGLKFEPCRVGYNGTTLNKVDIVIETRDYYGIPDGVEPDARPTSLSNDNKYNLFNQGWYQKANNRSGTVVNVIDEFYTKELDFPAKIYQWWRGKREANYGQFFSEDLRNIYSGRLEAPKGHFVIDVFRRNYSRSVKTNTTTKQEFFGNSVNGPAAFSYGSKDEERNRPAAVAWYAGRLFWAGAISDIDGALASSPDLTGYLFYSQTVRSELDYGKCYQEADPASEEDSDLVASDGGYMVFPGAGRVQKLAVIMDSLIVMTDKQVLAIRGGDAGFTAEAQQSYKILDVGIAGPGCAVIAEGSLFLWAKDGIYSVGYNGQSGGISAQNLSSGKIQDYLTQINPIQQAYVQSVYDSLNKRVSWWYNSDNSFNGVIDTGKLVTELSYDILLQAFCKNALASNNNYLATSPFYTVSPRVSIIANNVTSGADTVVSGSDNVTVGGSGYSYTANKVFMFLINTSTSTLGVSYYKNTAYKDYGLTTYTAFLQGNNDILGDATSKKYPTYFRCQFRRTETAFINNGSGQPTLDFPSSCKMQAKWDYSDSDSSGKWSTEQEIYRFTRAYMPGAIGDAFDYGQEVITTKTKVLGTGRSLSMKFSAVAGKGFHLLGFGFEGVANNAL
jgi:hypothetical protein